MVTTLSGASQTWITRNLGATAIARAATSTTNAEQGCYFQFNRAQAYGFDGGAVNPAWTITSISENSNWLTANDPCRLQLGGSWRLPTSTEWTNADGGWANYNNTYASVLKIHGAGYLNPAFGGDLHNRGAQGGYWSSTQYSDPYAYNLAFNFGSSSVAINDKTSGLSVRCLK